MPTPSPDPQNSRADMGCTALRALIRSWRGNFGRPLRIERAQGKLNVVLEATPSGPVGRTETDAAAIAPETQVLLMRLDLEALLDRCGNSRTALPHLAALEHGLQRRGMRLFDEMALPLLRRASGQLDGLVQEPVPEGIALLQARLDVAIVGREESVAVQCKPNALSSFFVEHKLEVSEVTMSTFMRIAGYPETEPLDLPDRPA